MNPMPSLRLPATRPALEPLPFRLPRNGGTAPDFAPASLLASGFHELMAGAPGDEGAALALAFSMASQAAGGRGGSLCFCGLASETQERGALYGHGFGALGLEAGRLIMITAPKEQDLLWTLEEAIASGAFGAVIGALGARERLYAFAASRRLKLRASANETPLFLLRHRSNGGATAAQGRWRVSSMPSRPEGGHGLLGRPRLRLRLERMAGYRPRNWEMEFDAARGFHMAPLLENGPAGGAGKRRPQAA
jgi:protein ImuA